MHSATIQDSEMLFQLVGRKNSPWTKQLIVPERSNLTYFLYQGKKAPETILQLPSILKSLEEGEPGITLVYVQSIQEGSEIYVELLNYCEENNLVNFPAQDSQPDMPVSFLHSSLTEKKKVEIIERAIACKIKILVATSAAGAGINLPVVKFVGWGLDRQASGIIQSQGRTARNPFTGEGIVIWVYKPKIHGRRLSASSKVRELLQTDCLRRTINNWFSHGLPAVKLQNQPEFCCNLCMDDCVQESGCQICQTKLDKFKPQVSLINLPEAEKMLGSFLKSLHLNQATPTSTPHYCEESLAKEIVNHLKESQDVTQITDFLSIFSLGDEVTNAVSGFIKESRLGIQFTSSDLSEPASLGDSSSDSGSSTSSVSQDRDEEYFDSESDEEAEGFYQELDQEFESACEDEEEISIYSAIAINLHQVTSNNLVETDD